MNDPSPLALLCRERFPGLRFRPDILKMASRILTTKGEADTVAFLSGKGEENPPTFKLPVSCPIVVLSRPVEQWPISLASAAIQARIYGQTQAEFDASPIEENEKSRAAWLEEQAVDTHGYTSAQGLNLIFRHARARYEGVIKKIENRNKKRQKKLESINARRREDGLPEFVPDAVESPFTESGHLAQPPGINQNMYCYQGVRPKSLVPGEVVLPEVYRGYSRRGSDPIIPIVPVDRLSIPEGVPGYVPEHQRALLSTKKHRRMRVSWSSPEAKANASLLVIIRIQSDWAIIDLRPILRNAYWRRVVSKKSEITLNGLIDLMTEGPVLSGKPYLTKDNLSARRPRMKAVPKGEQIFGTSTFSYTFEAIQVHSEKLITSGKRSAALFSERYADQTVSLVSVDLGKNNLLAAGVYRIAPGSPPEVLHRFTLPEDLIRAYDSVKQAHDVLEVSIRASAIASLSRPRERADGLCRLCIRRSRNLPQIFHGRGKHRPGWAGPHWARFSAVCTV